MKRLSRVKETWVTCSRGSSFLLVPAKTWTTYGEWPHRSETKNWKRTRKADESWLVMSRSGKPLAVVFGGFSWAMQAVKTEPTLQDAGTLRSVLQEADTLEELLAQC